MPTVADCLRQHGERFLQEYADKDRRWLEVRPRFPAACSAEGISQGAALWLEARPAADRVGRMKAWPR